MVGILSSIMISKVCAINETVEVAACDYLPKEEDFVLSVRFCPNLKYTIVLECSVTNTYSLQWMINNSVVTFYPDDPCNETKGEEEGFSLNLVKVTNNSIVSQLRVSTNYLASVLNDSNSNEFSVACHASVYSKRMSFIRISGIYS